MDSDWLPDLFALRDYSYDKLQSLGTLGAGSSLDPSCEFVFLALIGTK
jgi:hypothetical protein